MPGGLLWRLVFAPSFALINMEEDAPAVSGCWSPLSLSEDFSALFTGKGFSGRTITLVDDNFAGNKRNARVEKVKF